MKIVCVGDCGTDHYLPSGKRICGGITANFARHAAAIFADTDEVHVVSVLGSDTDGARIVRDALEGGRIRCHFALREGTTPVQYIRNAADGEKIYVRYEEGVLADYRLGSSEAEVLRGADLLVAPVFLQMRGFFASILGRGVRGTVAVDFADFAEHPDFAHLESFLDRIDIAFFGLSTAHEALMTRLESLSAARKKLFVVTLGAAGSRAFAAGRRHSCAAVTVARVADTTGAGDAFAAAFLHARASGADVDQSLAAGAARAALIVQRMGAWDDALSR